MTWSTFCFCRRPPWTSCLSGWCLAASRRSGTIRCTSGSGIHGCLKEIRNYPLYIRFRYSWLPQGDQELSAIHPVQVFMAASRRSRTIPSTVHPVQVFIAASRRSGFILSTSDSGIHGCLKEIRNYPLYSIHPVQVFMAAWRRSGTIRSTSGWGIHGCLKEIRNYPFHCTSG